MSTPTHLESRIVRLEKSAHRWKLASFSLLFLTLASLSLGQIRLGGNTGGISAPLVSADTLTAKKSITLLDSNQKPRILLSIQNDNPSITLTDPDNHPLLTLSADNKSASILLQDNTGKKIFSAP